MKLSAGRSQNVREHGERIQYVGNANVLKNLVVNVQLKGVLDGVDGR